MDEERVEVTLPERPVFTREQKAGYAVVIACGVLAVTLGVFYMGKHITSPFAINYTGDRLLTGEAARAAEVTAQKSLDTDLDGMNDYDEMNVYGSSPYLSDTDGDGMNDNMEITSGGDPTCAIGAACSNTNDALIGNTVSAGDLLEGTGVSAAAATTSIDQIKQMLTNMSPADIRTMLIDAGGDAAQITAMSDTEVTAMYAETVAQLESSGQLDAIIAQIQQAQATPPVVEETPDSSSQSLEAGSQ